MRGSGLVGEAERIDRAQEERAAAEADVGVDDLLPLGECLPRRREERLDVVEGRVEPHRGIRLVDALDPVGRRRVRRQPRQLALLVVQVLGAVDAGANLHLVLDEVRELLLVHEREVLTIVNSRRLPASLFFSRASSMMCLTTGKLTSGSPP